MLRPAGALLLALAAVGGDRVSIAPEAAARFDATLQDLDQALARAIDISGRGQTAEAKAAVGDAYFEIFEGRGIEAAIAALDAGEKSRLEGRFQELRAAIGNGRPRGELETIARDIVSSSRVRVAPHPLGEGFSLFLQSFLILLREGVEAILVVSALAAYLAKVGHGDKTHVLYQSAGAAIAASMVFAALLALALGRAGTKTEVIEGASMLLAAAVLFWVSYWLLAHAQQSRWDHFIKSKMAAAVSKGSLRALALASFLAVFREGAETVLFYEALFVSGGRTHAMAVITGMLLAALGLAAIFVAMKWLGLKLPLRPFFRVTGTFLYILAFVFIGRGIVELQAGHVVSVHPVRWFPAMPAIGVFPYVEPLAGQALLLAAALVAMLLLLRPGSRTKTAVAATLLLLLPATVHAQTRASFREYPIGEEQVRYGMKLAAVYLPPVTVDGQDVIPEAGKERIHLECDIHAVKGNENGFGIGEWIPMLTITYELLHVPTGKKITGELAPMVAKDGPHYGATLKMVGTGQYKLTYAIKNPGHKGLGRHTDPVTGVKDWFPDFSVDWTFQYEGAPTFDATK
ncbi:MAG: iron transporter [Acidobacteriota bacterium]